MEVATACYQEKLDRSRLVTARTFDHWAEAHHRLFVRLLASRGTPLPEPAPGFRFGLLRELDLPPDVDASGVGAVMDDVARHLYFGRHDAARAMLLSLEPQFPQVQKLLRSLPAR